MNSSLILVADTDNKYINKILRDYNRHGDGNEQTDELQNNWGDHSRLGGQGNLSKELISETPKINKADISMTQGTAKSLR